MNALELRAEPRTILGKKVGALRRQGIVPANIYGQSVSTAIQIQAREAERILHRAGRTQLITVDIAGSEPATVVIKEWQRHPFRGHLLHLDFFRVAMTQRLRIDVPVRIVGEAPAVKSAGGTLLQALTTVSIESLPGDIPEALDVDVSGLTSVDDSVYVRDLSLPDTVTILTGGDEMLVKVMAPRVDADEAGTAETAEGAEAAAETPTSAEGASADSGE